MNNVLSTNKYYKVCKIYRCGTLKTLEYHIIKNANGSFLAGVDDPNVCHVLLKEYVAPLNSKCIRKWEEGDERPSISVGGKDD